MKTVLFNTGIASVAAALFVSCGGGGGRLYPPGVAVNKIGLAKIPWETNYETGVKSLFRFPDYEQLVKLDSQQVALYGTEYEGIHHEGMVFEFTLGKKKYLFVSRQKSIWIFRGHEIVKRIRVPRYVVWAYIENIVLGGEEYAVVYVKQQATSCTSTLFLFDQDLDIKYQEHLMIPEAIGFGENDTYGSFFFVKSKYPYTVVNGIRTSLRGDWLYYLPGSEVGGE